jgi:beta-galactosidase/beta-glucuronidase
MARDIRLIKGAGFNAVRFEKNIPHPYLLYLCAREGLLAFIEMPISNLPASFSDDPLLSENLRSFAQLYLKGYKISQQSQDLDWEQVISGIVTNRLSC